MYFIECNYCGHQNPLKTEYQTFCEDCGKKMTNNFQVWKQLHPGSNFNAFKREVCIQKETPVQQYNNQEPDKSNRKRSYIILVASLVVFGTLGGIFGRKIAVTTMDYIRPYTMGSFSSADPDSWQVLISEEGVFEISFPGEPLKGEQNSTTPNGEIHITTYVFEPEIGADDNLSYVIAHSNYPAYTIDSRYMTGIEMDQVLDQSVLGSAQSVQGTLLSSKKIKLGNFRGKEFEISVQNDMAVIVGRSYLVNNTVYSLNVIEPKTNKSNVSTMRFLDSFRLIE